MKKRNRLVETVFLTMLGVLMLTGCGSAQKPQITLNIKTSPYTVRDADGSCDPDVMVTLEEAGKEFAEQYKDADVTVNVVKFQYTDEDKYIKGCFDTPDAADILFESYFNMADYIHTGRVVPLDDIISDDLRQDVDSKSWEISSFRNKTYMLPYYTLPNTLIYNKALFRDCGLQQYMTDGDVITSWSLDEWDTILDTLAEKLPAMKFPMMMYGGNEQGDTHIMTLLRSQGCSFFDQDGNFCINTPEGIAALQWIQAGVKKGWYPTGCENMVINDMTDLFMNGQLAIYMANTAIESLNDNQKYGRVNFPSKDGKGYTTSFITGFMAFDNGNADKTKAAKAFLQYFYGSQKYMNRALAGQPVRKSIAAANKDALFMSDAFVKNAANTLNFTDNHPNWRGVRSVFWTHIHDLLDGSMTPEACAAAIDQDCNAAIAKGYQSSKIHE